MFLDVPSVVQLSFLGVEPNASDVQNQINAVSAPGPTHPDLHGLWRVCIISMVVLLVILVIVLTVWPATGTSKSNLPLQAAKVSMCGATGVDTHAVIPSNADLPTEAADQELEIGGREDKELAYVQVQGASEDQVQCEWAWVGKPGWHTTAAQPRFDKGVWEMGPVQTDMATEIRITVNGRKQEILLNKAIANGSFSSPEAPPPELDGSFGKMNSHVPNAPQKLATAKTMELEEPAIPTGELNEAGTKKETK